MYNGGVEFEGLSQRYLSRFLWRMNNVISDYFWIPKMEQELILVKYEKSSQEHRFQENTALLFRSVFVDKSSLWSSL